MSLYQDASLVMIPSAYKDGKLYSIKPTDGSGDFTFSRGSNLAATRVDENGLVEKGRENLLLQSNQFDTTWTNSNTTETSGQADKDGGTNAWLLTKTAASGYIVQLNSSTNLQTFSVYAKANTSNWIQLLTLGSGTGSALTFFDLQNGLVGSSGGSGTYRIDSNIENVGNGWYRCSITINTNLYDVRIYPAESDNDTSGTSGSIYIQDAQLEQGLVATDYIETTTTTAQAGILEDMPRLDYSGGASCPSLLLEPQRTNNIAYSEYFNGLTLDVVTVAYNVISPENITNAATLTGTDVFPRVKFFPALSDNTAYCVSVFVKSGTASVFGILAKAKDGSDYQLECDLSDGSTTSVGTNTPLDLGSVNYGNGWYRFYMVYNSLTGATSSPEVRLVNHRSSSTNGWTNGLTILAYGGMHEQGSYPTSYIPCYGATTTRSDDFNNENDLISTPYVFEANDNFTFMYEGSFFEENGQSNMLCGGGKYNLGSTYKSYWWLRTDTDEIQLNGDGEVAMALANYTFPAVGTNGKYLVRKSDGVIDFFVNGTKLTTTQLTTNLRFDVRSAFWSYNTSVYQVSGKAKQFLIFNTALTDSECIALTTL